jgi:hypothetical protein
MAFLSTHRQQWLNMAFMDKPVSGKYYIPIGPQILTLKSFEERKTKNGKDMLVIDLYKPPESRSNKQSKLSFKPIKCFHIVGRGGDLSSEWFKPFTVSLSRKQLELLKTKKGSKFKGVVRQRVKHIVKDGQLQHSMGGPARYVECEVVSVHGIDEDVDVNYFELFSFEDTGQ